MRLDRARSPRRRGLHARGGAADARTCRSCPAGTAADQAAEHRVRPVRRRGRRHPRLHAQGQGADRGPGRRVRELLRDLPAVLPVARLDPARPVSAQHAGAGQPAARGRLSDFPPPRPRGVDDRHLAARRRLSHRVLRQVPERLHRDRRAAAGLGRMARRQQRRLLQRQLQAQRERRGRGLWRTRPRTT